MGCKNKSAWAKGGAKGYSTIAFSLVAVLKVFTRPAEQLTGLRCWFRERFLWRFVRKSLNIAHNPHQFTGLHRLGERLLDSMCVYFESHVQPV